MSVFRGNGGSVRSLYAPDRIKDYVPTGARPPREDATSIRAQVLACLTDEPQAASNITEQLPELTGEQVRSALKGLADSGSAERHSGGGWVLASPTDESEVETETELDAPSDLSHPASPAAPAAPAAPSATTREIYEQDAIERLRQRLAPAQPEDSDWKAIFLHQLADVIPEQVIAARLRECAEDYERWAAQ